MNENVKMPENIFVIIDPTSEKQTALDRAVAIAKTYNGRIHAYVGIYSRMETDDPEMLKRVETTRYRLWLEPYLEPIRAQGIEIKEHIDWTPDWRESMTDAAIRLESDLIVKPSSRNNPKSPIRMTSSDIALFQASRCPVHLVSDIERELTYKILAAVDPKRTNESYRRLYEYILEFGKKIAAAHADEGGEFHVVYAYSDSDDYMHVTDVARETGVPPEQAHVISGRPEEAVSRVAKELDAYLVIIGLSTTGPITNRIFGATSDWILNNIEQDLLIIV